MYPSVRPLRVVIAPDSFKGTLDATAAAAALAAGWARARPDDEVLVLPLADGGEGTLDALGNGLPPACLRSAVVTGPDGDPVEATWLLRPDGTAVVELAQAAGITQLDPLDPLGASTDGVGELLRTAAEDASTTRVLLTLGGSATTDGGSGALTTLGARLLDAAGVELPPGGGALAHLYSIDLSGMIAAPRDGLECSSTSPTRWSARLEPLSCSDRRRVRPVWTSAPSTPHSPVSPTSSATPHRTRWTATLQAQAQGAAGGTAFGLLSCWPGQMVPGSLAVAEAAGLADALADADIAITGEGRFDDQSVQGKVVGNLLAMAATCGTPVAVVAGIVAALPEPPAVTTVSLTDLAGSARASMAEPARWLIAAGNILAHDETLLRAVMTRR